MVLVAGKTPLKYSEEAKAVAPLVFRAQFGVAAGNCRFSGKEVTMREPTPAPVRRRRLWPVFVPFGIVVVLAAGWTGLWFYAASAAEKALAGWRAREADRNVVRGEEFAIEVTPDLFEFIEGVYEPPEPVELTGAVISVSD